MAPQIQSVEWIKLDEAKAAYVNLASFISLGIVWVYQILYPATGRRLRSVSSDPEKSDAAIITLDDDPTKEHAVVLERVSIRDEVLISFDIKSQRFIACSVDGFEVYPVADVPAKYVRFLLESPPYDRETRDHERKILVALYGENRMNIKIPEYHEVVVRYAAHPIIIFGYFSVIVWGIQNYYWWCLIVGVGILGALYALTDATMFDFKRLEEMAAYEENMELVDPYDGSSKTVGNTSLVVGDRFTLSEGFRMPCDAVLISGRVVMDESTLTGESVPVAKMNVDGIFLSEEEADVPSTNYLPLTSAGDPSRQKGVQVSAQSAHDEDIDVAEKKSGSVLFAGTKVLHAQGVSPVCVCYRTGFRSTKGQLIASLIEPNADYLHFIDDLIIVTVFMFVLSTVLFIYQGYYLYTIGASAGMVVLAYFDMITDAIPIGLALCLLFSTAVSIVRLKGRDMFVSDSVKVNIAGLTTIACFDKTGTLTEETLQFRGAHVSRSMMSPPPSDASSSSLHEVGENMSSGLIPPILTEVMACCQGLALLGPDVEPVGDFLEMELFRASKWKMVYNSLSQTVIVCPPSETRSNTLQSHDMNQRYEILRYYEYSAMHPRSACVLLRPTREIMYLTKGSPESILSMCASSSIPDSISDNLTSLAKRGLRVLAFAYKSYGDNRDVAMHLHPEEVESSRSLLFGGLLCLTSKLKVDAIQTVRELMDADIQVKMITGDHVRTAMAVAADCSIVPPIESSVDNAEREAMKFDLTSLTKDYHYIVDENEAGYVSIIDVFTDSHTDLSVVQLLELAARADEKQGLSFGTFAYQATSGNDDVEEGASLLAGVTTGEVQGDLGAKGSSEYTTFPSTTLSMSALLNRSGRIHIAVTGRGIAAVKRVYAPFVVDSLLRCTKVFARAKPTDKQFIVEELQKTPKFGKNYDERSTLQPTTESVVGTEFGNNQGKPGSSEEKPPSRQQDDDIILFTGDGANDMAALRTANVGLSLCDVETSIAAPVTSKSGSPGAVLELLKEARASLMIGFSLAHFYILFSTIMLFEIVILFDYGLILSDSMFFVQGIYEILGGVVLILAVRRDKLSEELPPVRYFSYDLMVVFVPQFILIPIFQILALVMLSYQDFYVRYETDDPLMHSYAFETAVLQNVALMQLAIITITSSIGSPFTSEWWEDWRFVFVVVVEIVWALYQTFAGASSFAENTLNLEPVPTSFGYDLVIFYVVMFAVSLLTWTASHRLLRVARRRRKLPALLLEN